MSFLDMTTRILGINRRNRDYVECQAGPTRQQVDHKEICKSILRKNKLPVVPTIFLIKNRRDIKRFFEIVHKEKAVAIKPAQGSGGNGLMLLFVNNENIITNKKGQVIAHDDIIFHILGILNGDFSNSGQDIVIVEPIIRDDESIARIHEDAGLSDIRVVMYNNKLQMAMLRLPCLDSHGAANLHAGGIGCGIDLSSGHCSFAIRYDKIIERHPDTGYRLANIKTPYWGLICDMLQPLNRIFNMKFLGIDLVIDEKRGPLLLEVNARPGLAVQIANRIGLRGVLNGATE